MDEDVEGGCGHQEIDCPICRGEMSPVFIERIMAMADQAGPVMTREEFLAWLDDQAASAR